MHWRHEYGDQLYSHFTRLIAGMTNPKIEVASISSQAVHTYFYTCIHCAGWISKLSYDSPTTPTLLGKVEQWRELFAIGHPWPRLSKLTKERVCTCLHRIDARGGGILQEMAHKVNCFWGCSRSEYLVGEGREREREEEREREGGRREREDRHRERIRVRKELGNQ